jgi:hypothetical protein
MIQYLIAVTESGDEHGRKIREKDYSTVPRCMYWLVCDG